MGVRTGYRVQTRGHGGTWQTVRTWTDRIVAEDDARALFAQVREIDGVFAQEHPFTIPMHPYVRVMHGTRRALVLGGAPASVVHGMAAETVYAVPPVHEPGARPLCGRCRADLDVCACAGSTVEVAS